MTAQAKTTAVATIEPRQTGILGDVQRMEKQFALALPEHVSPDRFVRVVMTAINSNPDLKKADRESILGAAMKCAQDGLLPDGKEAALVVYGAKAQYLPMIAGVLTKVRRSGELKTISAHVVYEHDSYSYELGDEERIEHKPRIDGPRGKAVAVYAIAHTKDGGIYREWMTIEEVNQVRNVSRAKNNGPWVAWWGEMARKTVLRRLAKRLPMSTDLMQVFQRDDDHYDLSRAEGSAKLRRLHADFEEPQEEATDAEFTEATEDGSADAVGAATDDPRAAAELSGADPAEEPDFDLIQWATDLNRGLDAYETLEALNAVTDDPVNVARFQALETANAGIAKALIAALNGRRKALADKERG